jgi:branched-chain amino acid transport system permease protein
VAAIALATLAMPLNFTDAQRSVFILIGLAAIVTTGLSLLMGFAGQASLGQGAFYAIGAYAAGLLTTKSGWPPALALAAAPATAAVIATLIGIPLLRLRGHYLAFATLAFHLIVLAFLSEAKDLTRGDIGFGGIPELLPIVPGFTRSFEYSYVTWLAVAGVLLLSHNLVASRPGRALRALATSEVGAASAGVEVGRYKLQVFALSAAYAGLAGGIYAFFISFVSPGSFPILISIQYLVMASVGGLGVIGGSVVGATGVTLLVQFLRDLGTRPGMSVTAPSILSYGAYGLVLVLVMLFLPGGLYPTLRDLVETRVARR